MFHTASPLYCVLGGEVGPNVDAHPARLAAETNAITFARETHR
jgi:hypothetical protein